MWRTSIINLLKQRGTYRACDAIRKLQSELPELEWLKWVLADVQDETRRITWTPSRPDEILKLTDNPELRLVQNGDQLLDVIIESLRRLDMQLQAETPLAPYLWDRDGKADARPKDENSLSNYVKIHLDKDVKTRGIICNREVQIHRGERTDIHVDAIVPASFGNAYDIVSVIIEVKGCWNHDIHESMQGQLIDRYLKDNLCQHGLYLVGWFNCEQWDKKDYRRNQAYSLCENKDDAQARFDAQASNFSQGSLRVKALVLDVSLH